MAISVKPYLTWTRPAYSGRCLNELLLHLQKKTFLGFKISKDRLTVMISGNAAGDCKLKSLLVYRSENPRALKNKSKAGLPVIWKSNIKARVIASVFEDWFGHHSYLKSNVIENVNKFCLK